MRLFGILVKPIGALGARPKLNASIFGILADLFALSALWLGCALADGVLGVGLVRVERAPSAIRFNDDPILDVKLAGTAGGSLEGAPTLAVERVQRVV